MLNYTFSRREKFLLLVLAVILLAMLWYFFVWQGAANQRQAIDSEIAEIEAQTLVANNKVSKLATMQQAIDQQKAAGAKPSSLPAYDNTTALMAQLNTVLASTTDYKLTFDELDRSAEGVVARGVTITFGCESMDAGRSVLQQLEGGPFACRIDSATIASTNSADSKTQNSRIGVNASRTVNAPYAVGAHVIFYESTV